MVRFLANMESFRWFAWETRFDQTAAKRSLVSMRGSDPLVLCTKATISSLRDKVRFLFWF
jgi:hypothetical protein